MQFVSDVKQSLNVGHESDIFTPHQLSSSMFNGIL